MAQIYERLSVKHLRTGWPIYWRIMLPPAVHVAFLGGAIAVVFLNDSSVLDYYVERYAPSLVDRPIIPNAAISVLLYAMGFPLVRLFNGWLSRKFNCEFYRSQFAILATVERFNGVLYFLYLLFVFLMISQWDYFRESLLHFWLWVVFLGGIFLGVVAMSASLYGWLHEQFEGENIDP
jgi:hypothetical protein